MDERRFSSKWLSGGLRAGLRNTPLHPAFHFAFEPAGATAQFDGFWEDAILNKFIKPFIRHFGVVSYEWHIDQLVAEQAGIVILSCHNDGLHMER